MMAGQVGLEHAFEEIRSIIERENNRGGDARYIVQKAGDLLGVDLGDHPLGGNIWSYQNMTRVLVALQELLDGREKALEALTASLEGVGR